MFDSSENNRTPHGIARVCLQPSKVPLENDEKNRRRGAYLDAERNRGEMITPRATTVLQHTWKGTFHLEHPTLVSDRGCNDVLRYRVQSPATLPESVIVKRIQNPLDPIRGLTEWASRDPRETAATQPSSWASPMRSPSGPRM